jgi:hypothetical protein
VYVRGQGRLLAPILFGAPFADSIWDATLVASHILRNGKCEPAPIPTFRATHRKLGCTDTHAQLDQRWADLHRQYGPIVHGSLDIHVQKPFRCGRSDDSALPDLDEEFFDARFTHRSHFGSAGNPIRRLRPTGQWTCWRTCWRHGGPRRLSLAGATTPFAWVAIWVTHSSGPGHRLLGHHRARPGRLASGCRGRGAAKCTRHTASGRNRLRFHQRSARAG